MEHDGVPDDTAYRLAMPCDTLPGPLTDPPVAPSAFPGRVAGPGCAPCRGRGTLDAWTPPSGTLCLTPAHFLEGLQHMGGSSLQPTPALLPIQGLWGCCTGSPRTAAATATVVPLWLQ